MPLSFGHTTSEAGSITLEWLPPVYDGGAKITGYYIYYKVAGSTTWSKTSLVTFDKFAHTVDSITPDTQYALKIVAVNVKGESV